LTQSRQKANVVLLTAPTGLFAWDKFGKNSVNRSDYRSPLTSVHFTASDLLDINDATPRVFQFEKGYGEKVLDIEQDAFKHFTKEELLEEAWESLEKARAEIRPGVAANHPAPFALEKVTFHFSIWEGVKSK
jgi:hypothetical protein